MGEEPAKPAEGELTPPPTPDQKPEKSYGQADVDSITDKVRSGLQKKLDAQTKQLEELKTANLSEQEKAVAKAVADAKNEGRAEKDAELTAYKRTSTIERLLAAKGVTNAEQVARLIDADADPEEGVSQLEKDMPQLFTTNKVGGGGGRNLPSDGDESMSEEHVNEMIQKHGPQWLTLERRDRLNKWRSEHQGTIRRLN